MSPTAAALRRPAGRSSTPTWCASATAGARASWSRCSSLVLPAGVALLAYTWVQLEMVRHRLPDRASRAPTAPRRAGRAPAAPRGVVPRCARARRRGGPPTELGMRAPELEQSGVRRREHPGGRREALRRSRWPSSGRCSPVWAGAIGCRLYDLQVVRHDEYRRRAERQQQRVVELDPPRGTIYDARGRELAVSVEVESAVRRAARGRRAAAPRRERCAAALGVDAARTRARSSRAIASSSGWRASSIRRMAPAPARARAARHLLPAREQALLPDARARRRTSSATSAPTTTASPGSRRCTTRWSPASPAGAPCCATRRRGTVLAPDLSFAEAEPGDDLHLTLDATLQHIVERELGRGGRAPPRASSGSAVLLDPRDGAVLAHGLVARPSTPTTSATRDGGAAQPRRCRTPTSRARPSRW